jgi:hypothetical protein
MAIHYVLFENKLTSAPDDYMARVQPTGTAELDDVIDRMIDMGSTVGKADAFSVLEDYYSAIESMVLEGKNVNTPAANYKASIRGVFDGPEDSFDPERHQLRGAVSSGKRFRDTIEEHGEPVKREAVKPRPNPLEYIDFTHEASNSTLTPGGMGQVVGHRLKFDPTDEAQGIFFVAEDGTETKVAVVGRNKPAELIFMVPDSLTAGQYTLEVRAVLPMRDDLRVGVLDASLVVP